MTCHVARRVGEFERRLRRDRREVWRALVSTDAELAGVERHHPGEFVDAAARETSRRLLWHFEERDQHVLAELDAAGERLTVGTFGICEACARAIPFPRLRALPTARLCVTCQETEERAMPGGARTRGPEECDDLSLDPPQDTRPHGGAGLWPRNSK